MSHPIDLFQSNMVAAGEHLSTPQQEVGNLHVYREEHQLSIGDAFWWQLETCYCTRYVNGQYVGPEDVHLKKIGFSGVNRPGG